MGIIRKLYQVSTKKQSTGGGTGAALPVHPAGSITTHAAGNLAANTDISGLNAYEVQRLQHFGYIAPAIAFSLSSTFAEKGLQVNIAFTASYTKNGGGNPTQARLIEGNNTVQTINSPATPIVLNGRGIVADTTYKLQVDFPSGTNATTPGTRELTRTVTFYAPCFSGVGAAALNEAFIKAMTKEIRQGQKGASKSFTVSNGHIYYAYPKAFGALTSIKDPNNFEVLGSFTRREQTFSFTGIPNPYDEVYYIYELTNPTTQNNFTLTFA